MKRFISVYVLLLLFVQANAMNMTEFTNKADLFFKKYVSAGKVDYSSIKANSMALNELVTSIGNMSLSGENTNTKKAFYINAYNVLVIKGIVQAYPVQGPLKITGFFKTKKYKLSGSYTTLDQLEKVKLKALGADPRLHFILVCAANGCPQLASYAYRPEKLENQIEMQTRATMRSSYFIRVKSGESKVFVSEIFSWYRSEFPSGDAGLIKYINKYRSSSDQIPSSYKVSNYTYDWNLNKKK